MSYYSVRTDTGFDHVRNITKARLLQLLAHVPDDAWLEVSPVTHDLLVLIGPRPENGEHVAQSKAEWIGTLSISYEMLELHGAQIDG